MRIPLKVWLRAPFRFAVAMRRALVFRLMGRPVITPKVIQEYREAVCDRCAHNARGTCDLCACLIAVKVMLSSEECPDKPPRWNSLTTAPKSDTEGC